MIECCASDLNGMLVELFAIEVHGTPQRRECIIRETDVKRRCADMVCESIRITKDSWELLGILCERGEKGWEGLEDITGSSRPALFHADRILSAVASCF
jgi:hypothetical protein